MRKILQLASVLGLGLTIVPSILVMSGQLEWKTHGTLMFIGMLLWFASAPFWMRKDV